MLPTGLRRQSVAVFLQHVRGAVAGGQQHRTLDDIRECQIVAAAVMTPDVLKTLPAGAPAAEPTWRCLAPVEPAQYDDRFLRTARRIDVIADTEFFKLDAAGNCNGIPASAAMRSKAARCSAAKGSVVLSR